MASNLAQFPRPAVALGVKKTLTRYAICVSFLLLPVAVTVGLGNLGPAYNPLISASYLLALGAAAWWGGTIAGILTGLAIIPVFTLVATHGKLILPAKFDFPATIVILGIAILVGQVSGARRRVEEILRSVNDELERRVKERTAELESAHTWLETTISSIGDAVIATDNRGHLLFLNGTAQALTGWTQDQALGRPVGDIFVIQNEQTQAPTTDPVAKVLETGAIFGLANHTVLISRDGRVIPIDDSAAPIRGSSGDLSGVVLVFRDITERRRTEQSAERARSQLERNNQELEQFAFAASHDLQEPLRTISIYAQLIERRYAKKLDGEASQLLGYVVNGVTQMTSLVRDLLSYTQVWGAGSGEIVETDLRTVLTSVLSSLEASINAAAANIEYGALPLLHMNEVHLQQLLQNLIGNALKYRSEQLPLISVHAGRSGTFWVVRVVDNGIGIEPIHKDRIFEPFKRLHSSDEYPGTGIGLALCRKIVDRYGGQIWVESELGKGCTFCFTVPIIPESERTAGVVADAVASSDSGAGHTNIV